MGLNNYNNTHIYKFKVQKQKKKLKKKTTKHDNRYKKYRWRHANGKGINKCVLKEDWKQLPQPYYHDYWKWIDICKGFQN